MKTFTQFTSKALLAVVVALMAMMPLTASADMIHTPFAGMPGVNDNSLNPQEWLNKLNVQMQWNAFPQGVADAADAQPGFEPLWSTDMTMADKEASCDVSNVRRLADGGYIGVYTCGGGEKILEGRIVRMSSTGEKLWETVLQDSINTTVDKVCQGGDGRFYVLGTTMRNGSTSAYIACVDNTGKQVYFNTINDNMYAVFPVDVLPVGAETVIVYTTSTASYGGTKTLTARWFDASGKQTRDLYQKVSTTTTEYTSRLGDFLMVPIFSTDAFAIDLKKGTIALHATQENRSVYQNGCVNGDALYTLHKNASSMLVLTQYKVENGTLVEKWKCTTNQEHVGYDSFAHALNEGKVLIYNKQRQGGPGMAIINPDGTKFQDKLSVNFDDCNSAWGYAATQAADGTIYILGMFDKGMTFAISVLTTAADLSNPQYMFYNNLDPGYTLYYTQYDQSCFTDGQFVFSGYMRPEDFQKHGFTPMFGTYTPDGNKMQLLYKGTPGNIAQVNPGQFAVDKDYNVYQLLNSGNNTMLVKYDSTGVQVWSKTLTGVSGQLFAPVILSNGNICVGSCSVEDGVQVFCFTPDGQDVYSVVDESMLGVLGYINGVYAIEGQNNNLIVACTGYSTAKQIFLPFITKVDDKGATSSKLVTDFDNNTMLSGITRDNAGNVYVLGSSENSERIARPVILKIDANLQVLKAFIQDIDVSCPLYCGAVDSQGRIFVVGNTQYHGMVFVYDKDFNRLGYHIFDTATNTQSVYESISLSPEGNALVSACYKNDNNKRCGLIVSYNDKAEMQWKYERVDDGSGAFFLYDAAQYGSNIIAVGYYNSPLGAQGYALELNAAREIQKEYVMPQGKGYSTYSISSADIVNGNAYVAASYFVGRAMLGNLTCFGDPATADSVDELFADGDNKIVVSDGKARLSDDASATWEAYTVAGAKVMSVYASEVSLSSLQSGMYILTARTANGMVTKKLVK